MITIIIIVISNNRKGYNRNKIKIIIVINNNSKGYNNNNK